MGLGFGLGLGRRLMLDALLERDEDGEKEAPLVRVPLELVEHLQRGKRRRNECGRGKCSHRECGRGKYGHGHSKCSHRVLP